MPLFRPTACLAACALLVACATVPRHPRYEEAARAARESSETVEGARYERAVVRDIVRRRLAQPNEDAVRVCRVRIPETRGVELLYRLDASGAPLETITYPDTAFGTCVREGLELFPLPPPPEPDYWLRLRVPPRGEPSLGLGLPH